MQIWFSLLYGPEKIFKCLYKLLKQFFQLYLGDHDFFKLAFVLCRKAFM
jgi:hypothetical protein